MLIGLLNFYDEPRDDLLRAITSLREMMGVRHLVALDGRYALYPGTEYLSDPNQYATIMGVCRHLGMGCTLVAPDGPFQGGEVEKRTRLFTIGLALTETPGVDWFVVMDSDQVVVACPPDLEEQLAATSCDAATVTFHDQWAAERNPEGFPSDFPMRILFRAQPIYLERHHAIYKTWDGDLLWSAGSNPEGEVDALDLTDVRVDHRPMNRPINRLLDKANYYSARDHAGIEFGMCTCGAKATVKFHGQWQMKRGHLVGSIMVRCDKCAARDQEMDARRLRIMGVDPASVKSSERYGALPE